MFSNKLFQLPSIFIISIFIFILNSSSLAYAQVLDNVKLKRYKELYKRAEAIPFPEENPYSFEKSTLGKMLFFDQRLSGGQNMSCATCHNPSFGWEVPFPTAIGSHNKPLGRHAPTVFNVAWGEEYFWDGRAATLEEQAGGPIQAPEEMNMTFPVLISRLNDIPSYKEWFSKAFPEDGVTEENITKVIATYQRTIVSGISPFDKWVNGSENAITDSAKRGFILFNEDAKCANCHTSWNFTDQKYHDIGLPDEDIGRIEIDKSSDLNNHAFKTPTLRNLTQRSPFMHDGSIYDLEAVIAHYQVGGVDRPSRSPLMPPLDISEKDVEDLLSFLLSLTAEKDELVLPVLPN